MIEAASKFVLHFINYALIPRLFIRFNLISYSFDTPTLTFVLIMLKDRDALPPLEHKFRSANQNQLPQEVSII